MNLVNNTKVFIKLKGEEGKKLRAELASKDRKKMEEIARKDLEDSSDDDRWLLYTKITLIFKLIFITNL